MFDHLWGRWANLRECLMSHEPLATTFANINFLAYQLLIENWVLSRNMMPWNIWTFSSLLGKPSWRLDEPWTILYTSHLLHFYTRQIFSNLNFCQSRKIVFFLGKNDAMEYLEHFRAPWANLHEGLMSHEPQCLRFTTRHNLLNAFYIYIKWLKPFAPNPHNVLK